MSGLDAEILAELVAIRRLLERGGTRVGAPPARSLDVADRRRLAALLPVIHGQFGAESFASWEIFDTVDQGGVAGSDLRLALGGVKAHALGKLMRRACDSGVAIAGFSVRSEGRDGEGRRWIVDRSSLLGDPLPARVRAIDRRR